MCRVLRIVWIEKDRVERALGGREISKKEGYPCGVCV